MRGGMIGRRKARERTFLLPIALAPLLWLSILLLILTAAREMTGDESASVRIKGRFRIVYFRRPKDTDRQT